MDSQYNEKSYNAYVTHQLRVAYYELQHEFRALLEAALRHSACDDIDITKVRQTRELLLAASVTLGKDSPDLLSASNALETAQRYMIWFYRKEAFISRVASIKRRLESLDIDSKEDLMAQLQSIVDNGAILSDENGFESARVTLNEVHGTMNRELVQERVENGLQLRRLKWLLTWGLILLLGCILFSPFAIKSDVLSFLYPPGASVDSGEAVLWWFYTWFSIISVAMTGAIGGLISGLLQARSSKVDIVQFEQDVLKLQLKVTIGALLASVVIIPLSWGAIPGVENVDNKGVFYLVALLGGFSERYIFGLLNMAAEQDKHIQEEQRS